MAIGRHLVIETMEAAARMGKSVLTERIIYTVSFSTLNPQPPVMSTSFAKKISKKPRFSAGRSSRHPVSSWGGPWAVWGARREARPRKPREG